MLLMYAKSRLPQRKQDGMGYRLVAGVFYVFRFKEIILE